MKLRNLLHIQQDDIHIIGSLMPPFFYRASDIMREFIQLLEAEKTENISTFLKEKYSAAEFESFKLRLHKAKDNLFVNDNYKDSNEVDFMSKVSTLTLNITRKCNLKCSYCFEDNEYRKLGDMPFVIAKKAIDKFFIDNSIQYVIIFTGGEPILNFSTIKEVTEYISNKKLKVEYRIKTNATLLNDEKINFLIKNKFKIQISLDGNEKAHNTFRKFANGKGTFKIVDNVIHKFIEKGFGYNISVSGTLTHQTIQYADDCYAQLNSYQEIGHYFLKSVMPNSCEQFTFNENDHNIAYASNLKNNKHLVSQGKKWMGLNANANANICGIGIWNITIDVDGKIYPCYRMCGNMKYIIGDLNLMETSFKLPQELKNIYCIGDNDQCRKCYLLNVCKMGCYTDKTMYNYNANKCFLPTKEIIEKMLIRELFEKEIYLSLDIV